MDFFISNAYAQEALVGGDWIGMLFPLFLLAIFFFLFIRPQQKRAKEHKAMMAELKKGDEVISNGGLAGTISAVHDAFITVKVADKVEVNIQKQSIASLLPKGTLKKL